MDISLKSRYGDIHVLKEVSEGTYLATDCSRLLGKNDDRDEDGQCRFINLSAIDFDGGPFLSVGSELPNEKHIVKLTNNNDGTITILCI